MIVLWTNTGVMELSVWVSTSFYTCMSKFDLGIDGKSPLVEPIFIYFPPPPAAADLTRKEVSACNHSKNCLLSWQFRERSLFMEGAMEKGGDIKLQRKQIEGGHRL